MTDDTAEDTVAATAAASAPPLPGGVLDRAAHRRTDADWLAEAWPRSRVLVVDDGQVLVRGDPAGLVLLDAADAPAGERYFVGVAPDGTPYFAVAGVLAPPPGARAGTLRDLGHLLEAPEADLFLTAVALVNWHSRHGYSARSGQPTEPGEGGWTRVTADGETMWPRTDPAVIVLVHDGVPGPDGHCLLGHNASWTSPAWVRRYSCLAGFVEPGESAEATVVREVAEEVGVRVSAIRYLGSQAWPFPGSLMLGFYAVGVGIGTPAP